MQGKRSGGNWLCRTTAQERSPDGGRLGYFSMSGSPLSCPLAKVEEHVYSRGRGLRGVVGDCPLSSTSERKHAEACGK